jgi:hypothetical protein
MKRPSFLIGITALLALAALTLAGCGVGSGGPESKISKTTDTYLRSLSSGDTTKACAQLTGEAQQKLGPSCVAGMEKIAAAVGRDRLSEAADKGSSISVEGSNGSVTLKGLNDARIGLIKSGSNWLIESGYELDGAS